MSTEYRRGIPSAAHVEAATRLGLLWHREAHRPDTKTKFAIVRGLVESNYGYDIGVQSGTSQLKLKSNENSHSYRPIRPDGTPVDWEVLDLEVARVGQSEQPATVTSTASAAPTTQPQGFRAYCAARPISLRRQSVRLPIDLWARPELVVQQARGAHEERVQRAMASAVPQPYNPAAAPLTPENLMRQMQSYQQPPIPLDTIDYVNAEISRAVLGNPQPAVLPRFTADELDDVDHSRTTKLDQTTLRRGRLPTVEQIAKYREIRAKRTGGTVADALKESRIDCEVAQYVLERWAGGLGDADTVLLLQAAGCIAPLKDEPKSSIRAFDPRQDEVDKRAQAWLRSHSPTLDTTGPPDTAAQQARQQAEERRRRLAQVQAQIAAERATAQPQEVSEPSRFDLIEPDPQADPAASICAWEARQAAAKVRHTAAPSRIAKPAAALRRPAIEVVDAEADGLSRVEIVTALFGRALNGRC